ncbi:MAG: hypothetical protein IKM59_03205 [Oscillospiraceae bacterium]|nr:hypothetical protein [Oscillospiraceae bacterium]
MATFTNRATLTFNGGSTNSNTVTGEILEVLSATKTALSETYRVGDRVTYVVTLVNTGSVALTNLTFTDSLGAYVFEGETLYPLTYQNAVYYQNGVLQPTPTVNPGPPLTVTGITVPAGGNVTLVYEALINEFASPLAGGTVENTLTVTGGGLAAPITVTEEITAEEASALTIGKSVCPPVVTDNGELTYTFVIQNSGNTEAVATDNLVLTDLFDPILNPITVTYNGAPWTEGVNYTYDPTTGAFSTLPGQITVPAATFEQNPDGTWTVTPGTSVVTVTGTV